MTHLQMTLLHRQCASSTPADMQAICSAIQFRVRTNIQVMCVTGDNATMRKVQSSSALTRCCRRSSSCATAHRSRAASSPFWDQSHCPSRSAPAPWTTAASFSVQLCRHMPVVTLIGSDRCLNACADWTWTPHPVATSVLHSNITAMHARPECGGLPYSRAWQCTAMHSSCAAHSNAAGPAGYKLPT